MDRPILMKVLLLVALVASVLAAPRATVAQGERFVQASARCFGAETGLQPEVEVALTNRTGAPLVVSYVHGFTSQQVFMVMMTMEDQGDFPPIVVPDGETQTIRADWDELQRGPGYIGGALVVTNMGALVPACSERPVDADERRFGPAPSSDEEAKREAVAIAAETIGQLESWRAYHALYALLHPDARAEVGFSAIACWYAGQYGLPTSPLIRTVFSTEVTDLSFGAWTWDVNGTTYPDAATVGYRQRVGTVAQTEPVEGVEHLVEADGQWRWFFGISRDALAAMPTDCDLAGSSATDSGTVSVSFAECPAEMTAARFDPTACQAVPDGFASFVLVAGRDVPLDRLPGGPIYGFSTWTARGDGHFEIGGLPFGTYEIGPGTNYTGPPFYAPDRGEPLGQTGPAASTYAVTVDAGNPVAVIDFYRLG